LGEFVFREQEGIDGDVVDGRRVRARIAHRERAARNEDEDDAHVFGRGEMSGFVEGECARPAARRQVFEFPQAGLRIFPIGTSPVCGEMRSPP
jgi:hypothetical protein